MDQNEKFPVSGQDSRRDFIKKTATAAAAVAATGILKAPVYGQNQAPSANVTGANNKLNVGFIGVGRPGHGSRPVAKKPRGRKQCSSCGVCDVWTKRIEGSKQEIGGDCQSYDDYRKLLDRKDIDAVTVATVDHWHVPCFDGCT